MLICCKKVHPASLVFCFLLFGDQTPSAPLGTNAASSQIEAAWKGHPFQLFPFFVSKVAKKNGVRDSVNSGVKKTPSGSLHGFRFPKNSDLKQRGSCIKLRMWCNTC